MMRHNEGRRAGWKFEYPASQLAEGAKRQESFRRERVAFWQDAKAKTMDEIRATGIEITESIAAQISNYAGNKMAPQVTVRHDLLARLAEAHGKIIEHQQAADEYAGWVQVLEAQGENSLKLSHGDWLYFLGAPS